MTEPDDQRRVTVSLSETEATALATLLTGVHIEADPDAADLGGQSRFGSIVPADHEHRHRSIGGKLCGDTAEEPPACPAAATPDRRVRRPSRSRARATQALARR